MDRRSFLRSSCLGCAGLVVGAAALAGCATLPVVKVTSDGSSLDVPLIAFGEGTQVIARAAQLPFDVLVVRQPDGAYRSLYLRCTHEDQPLTATTTGLHCPSHGSRFGLDGSVEEGPATRPLVSFPTELQQDHLHISLRG
ncbi:MAG TPA: Rieske 2Fe-2S domain-containing protein [Flavobacteriales bacterium]|nr:Rieske 2Fe-2S domain-containing protein [Flavobacteriales bacterium]